jgi:hypothetical protein
MSGRTLRRRRAQRRRLFARASIRSSKSGFCPEFERPIGGNGSPRLSRLHAPLLTRQSSIDSWNFGCIEDEDSVTSAPTPFPQEDNSHNDYILSFAIILLGVILSPENGVYEYKETCIPRSVDYDLSRIFDMRVFPPALMQLCNRAFYDTVTKFFSKYLATFLNTRGGLTNGKIVFGVKDSGFVNGMLYFGTPSMRVLRRILRASVDKFVTCDQLVPGSLHKLTKLRFVKVVADKINEKAMEKYKNRILTEDASRAKVAHLKRFLTLLHAKIVELKKILQSSDPVKKDRYAEDIDESIFIKQERHREMFEILYSHCHSSIEPLSEPVDLSLGAGSISQILGDYTPGCYFDAERSHTACARLLARIDINAAMTNKSFATFAHELYSSALRLYTLRKVACTRIECYKTQLEIFIHAQNAILVMKEHAERLIPEGVEDHGSTYFRAVLTPNELLPEFQANHPEIGCYIVIADMTTRDSIPERFIKPECDPRDICVFWTNPETGEKCSLERYIRHNGRVDPSTRPIGTKGC